MAISSSSALKSLNYKNFRNHELPKTLYSLNSNWDKSNKTVVPVMNDLVRNAARGTSQSKDDPEAYSNGIKYLFTMIEGALDTETRELLNREVDYALGVYANLDVFELVKRLCQLNMSETNAVKSNEEWMSHFIEAAKILHVPGSETDVYLKAVNAVYQRLMVSVRAMGGTMSQRPLVDGGEDSANEDAAPPRKGLRNDSVFYRFTKMRPSARTVLAQTAVTERSTEINDLNKWASVWFASLVLKNCNEALNGNALTYLRTLGSHTYLPEQCDTFEKMCKFLRERSALVSALITPGGPGSGTAFVIQYGKRPRVKPTPPGNVRFGNVNVIREPRHGPGPRNVRHTVRSPPPSNQSGDRDIKRQRMNEERTGNVPTCFGCGARGHMIRDCKKGKRGIMRTNNQQSLRSKESTNSNSNAKGNDKAFMALHESNLPLGGQF